MVRFCEGGFKGDKTKMSVIRFKTLEEMEEYKWKEIFEKGIPYYEVDRFEMRRLKAKYPSGVYRFKTLKDKWEFEFKMVVESWK